MRLNFQEPWQTENFRPIHSEPVSGSHNEIPAFAGSKNVPSCAQGKNGKNTIQGRMYFRP
jgi:hypothetical protein